jgi:regulatory protein
MTTPPEPVGGAAERARAQAKDLCLRLLTARAHGRAELAAKLADKGFQPDVIEAVLDRLAAAKLVDDADLARQWVRSRHTRAGKGRQALAVELRRKGIDESTAADALASITVEDERERGADLVRRKLRTMSVGTAPGERDRALRRLVGMLARRGYSQGMAFAIVNAELSGADLSDAELPDADTFFTDI